MMKMVSKSIIKRSTPCNLICQNLLVVDINFLSGPTLKVDIQVVDTCTRFGPTQQCRIIPNCFGTRKSLVPIRYTY